MTFDTTTRRTFTASQLGMDAFPPHLFASGIPAGGHVSGFALMGWLTRIPIDRWGEDWIERGHLAVRNRLRLRAGTVVDVSVTHTEAALELEARGPHGVLAQGWAALPGLIDAPPDVVGRAASPPSVERLHVSAGIAGRSLGQLTTRFRADRDLRLVDHLDADDPWRGRTIAHPAYLVWVTNVLIKDAFGFRDGWIHAGTEFRNHCSIHDGAELTFLGRVAADPVRPGNHDLTTLDITVLADDRLAATLLVTIATGGTTPLAYKE